MNKTQSARPILVAIRTPTRAARALLQKAASLAKLYGAPLRIVHVLAIPQGALARAGTTIPPLVVKPRGFKSPVERQAYRQVFQRPRSRSLAYRQRQSGGSVTYAAH